MIEECFEGAERVFQGSFKGILKKFKGCFKEVLGDKLDIWNI